VDCCIYSSAWLDYDRPDLVNIHQFRDPDNDVKSAALRCVAILPAGTLSDEQRLMRTNASLQCISSLLAYVFII
jgi:hypothetical protein